MSDHHQSSKSPTVGRRVALGVFVTAVVVGGLLFVGNEPDAGSASSRAETMPAEQSSKPLSGRQIARIIRKQQRRGTQEPAVPPMDDAERRCGRAGSETFFTTATARLMYLDWRGEEQGEEEKGENRGAACFYETGMVTELGFTNTIEGDSFGQVASAGDFTGFVLSAWMADNEAIDAFEVWDLRAGQRKYRHSCSTENFDCQIPDIAVSAAGSLAYLACRNTSCLLIARSAQSAKRKTLARLSMPDGQTPAIHVDAGRVYWLQRGGKLRSARFP